jgi:hypothetical protein
MTSACFLFQIGQLRKYETANQGGVALKTLSVYVKNLINKPDEVGHVCLLLNRTQRQQ